MIEIIIYSIAIIITIGNSFKIRHDIGIGKGAAYSTATTVGICIVILIVIPIFDIDALHILWMFPLSIILGMLSMTIFPFSLLRVLGNLLIIIAYAGLDQKEIDIKRERVEKIEELVITRGITIDDAIDVLQKSGQW